MAKFGKKLYRFKCKYCGKYSKSRFEQRSICVECKKKARGPRRYQKFGPIPKKYTLEVKGKRIWPRDL